MTNMSTEDKPAALASTEGLGALVKDDSDDDSMSDYWRDVKAARQEKRASNRKSSAQMLTDAGVIFESKNIDAHLIVKAPGKTIDFWPGTGLWMVRGQPTRRYGVRGLIQFVGKPQGT